MNLLRRLLLSLLGEKNYLALLASSFQFFYKSGWLGSGYQDIYFLKYLLKKGDYCADIGAHLGYYTLEMSRLAGDSGRVIAIEPISKFHHNLQEQIWKRNLRNVELIQAAMGGDGPYVEMGIPKVNNIKKFAYARIKKSNQLLDYVESEQVKNESGDALFGKIPRLDFVKCDVEGLEIPVFQSMMATLTLHRPIILCELADKNERVKLFDMLFPLGYQCFILENKKLRPLDVHSDRGAISHNHYFIPASRMEGIQKRIGS